MKFNINQAELHKALSIVSKGASSNASMPVLAGVCITAAQGEVLLQASNLELSIKMSVPALVEEEGQAVLPAKLLTDIVKNLPDVAIRVEVDNQQALVTCNNASFSLKTFSALDFPEFPEVTPDQQAVFPFSIFSSMVKSTAKMVSRDETRPVLTGILISYQGTTCKMVSTDSYRLAVCETSLTSQPPQEFEAVISGSFLQDIASLSKSEHEVAIGLAENQIVVTYQDITFVNRRIEGTFPNYNQLISSNYSTRLTLSTAVLEQAIRRVSLLSNKVAPVQLHIDAEGGVVVLSTNAQGVGSAEETIICDIQGSSVDIAFNFSFMLDGLQVVTSDVVYLELFGPMKPGIFRTPEEQQNFLYLVMPVRI